MNYQEYLMHYGVLGMKWGQRKSRPFVSSYTKSYEEASKRQSKKAAKFRAKTKHGSNWRISGVVDLEQGRPKMAERAFARAEKKEAKWANKANKAEAKNKEYSRIAKKSAELDKKVENRLKSQSAGRRMISRLLDANGTGNKPYSTMRAAGVSRGKAVVSAMFNPSASLSTRDKYSKKK